MLQRATRANQWARAYARLHDDHPGLASETPLIYGPKHPPKTPPRLAVVMASGCRDFLVLCTPRCKKGGGHSLSPLTPCLPGSTNRHSTDTLSGTAPCLGPETRGKWKNPSSFEHVRPMYNAYTYQPSRSTPTKKVQSRVILSTKKQSRRGKE